MYLGFHDGGCDILQNMICNANKLRPLNYLNNANIYFFSSSFVFCRVVFSYGRRTQEHYIAFNWTCFYFWTTFNFCCCLPYNHTKKKDKASSILTDKNVGTSCSSMRSNQDQGVFLGLKLSLDKVSWIINCTDLNQIICAMVRYFSPTKRLTSFFDEVVFRNWTISIGSIYDCTYQDHYKKSGISNGGISSFSRMSLTDYYLRD